MCGEGVERRGCIPQIAPFGTRHCDILAHWATKGIFWHMGSKGRDADSGGWGARGKLALQCHHLKECTLTVRWQHVDSTLTAR